MGFIRKYLSYFFLLFLIWTLCACFSKNSGRHLSSDVCLVLPEKTTKQDVVRQLGNPDLRSHDKDGEIWIYYQVHKTFLRGIPWAGEYLGDEEYEVVKITFAGTQVRACTFRAMDATEFRALGLITVE